MITCMTVLFLKNSNSKVWRKFRFQSRIKSDGYQQRVTKRSPIAPLIYESKLLYLTAGSSSAQLQTSCHLFLVLLRSPPLLFNRNLCFNSIKNTGTTKIKCILIFCGNGGWGRQSPPEALKVWRGGRHKPLLSRGRVRSILLLYCKVLAAELGTDTKNIFLFLIYQSVFT